MKLEIEYVVLKTGKVKRRRDKIFGYFYSKKDIIHVGEGKPNIFLKEMTRTHKLARKAIYEFDGKYYHKNNELPVVENFSSHNNKILPNHFEEFHPINQNICNYMPPHYCAKLDIIKNEYDPEALTEVIWDGEIEKTKQHKLISQHILFDGENYFEEIYIYNPLEKITSSDYRNYHIGERYPDDTDELKTVTLSSLYTNDYPFIPTREPNEMIRKINAMNVIYEIFSKFNSHKLSNRDGDDLIILADLIIKLKKEGINIKDFLVGKPLYQNVNFNTDNVIKILVDLNQYQSDLYYGNKLDILEFMEKEYRSNSGKKLFADKNKQQEKNDQIPEQISFNF